MTFSAKKITTTFTLQNGVFEGGSNSYVATGLRTIVHISAPGGAQNSNAEVAIYGLPLSVMNALTTFGSQYLLQTHQNAITIEAGSDEDGMSVVFIGSIFQAHVDAQAMPQVAFRVSATPLTGWNVKPQTPISINGSGDVATIAGQIAGMMNFTLENNGVNTKLSNPYFAGSATAMMQQLAEHAGISYFVDRGTLAIVPRGGSRAGGPILVSPQTGLIGYPDFVSNSIVLKCLFNPNTANIKMLGQIQVQSDLTPACGTWYVSRVSWDLESSVPHGRWFMTVTANTNNPSTPQ